MQKGTKKIPIAPSMLIIEIDKPTSSSFALIIGAAPAIAEEPQIPFPIPSNNDNEGDSLNNRPNTNEDTIATSISKTINQKTFHSIMFKTEASKLAPINMIAKLSKCFSEKLIPEVKEL